MGFEPTYTGYGPAALPLSYPLIAVDAFFLQGASQAGTKGEPAHGDCCLRLSRHSFYACGSRTRRSPVSCRVLPTKLMHRKMLLSVSFAKHVVTVLATDSYVVAVRAFVYGYTIRAFPGFFLEKKLRTLLFRGKFASFFVILPPSGSSALQAAPGSGRPCSPVRAPSAPDRRRGCGSKSPSRLHGGSAG